MNSSVRRAADLAGQVDQDEDMMPIRRDEIQDQALVWALIGVAAGLSEIGQSIRYAADAYRTVNR